MIQMSLSHRLSLSVFSMRSYLYKHVVVKNSNHNGTKTYSGLRIIVPFQCTGLDKAKVDLGKSARKLQCPDTDGCFVS